MKKVRVICMTLAVVLAGVGVFASMPNTYVYYKHLSNTALCYGTIVSAPPCEFTGTLSCVKMDTFDDGEGNLYQVGPYYFSRQELNGSQQVSCIQYMRRDGSW